MRPRILILLVDDERVLLSTLQRVLLAGIREERAFEIEIDLATRAQEGLTAAERFFEAHPQGWLLLFSDRDMPTLSTDQLHSGLDLSQAIRTRFGPRSYTVLMTAHLPTQKPDYLDVLVAKPFNGSEILLKHFQNFKTRILTT